MIPFYDGPEWAKLRYCGKKPEQWGHGVTKKLSGLMEIFYVLIGVGVYKYMHLSKLNQLYT